MPNWLLPLGAFVILVGFMGYAFRQGTKVEPDRDNPDRWQDFGGPPNDGHSSS